MPEPSPPDPARRGVAAWLDWYARMGVLDAVDPPSAPTDPAPVPTSRRPQGSEGGERVRYARAVADDCTSLAALRDALETFEGCPLRATATRLCFADGRAEARLMLIGEAPGAEEDRQGRPFVGPSGVLLDRMLEAVGLDRADVWITNLLFWRPPGNRPPTATEVATCQPFLERQVELLNPAVILFLGGSAAKALLGVTDGVTRLRGRRHTYRSPAGGEVPAFVTFHPAYLLRQPLQKRLVWRDLLALRHEFGEVWAARAAGGWVM